MSSFALLASLAFVQLLAAMSPGPAFALVASRAAAGNRACALAAAAGVLSATATWIALAGFGAGALLAAAPGLYAACRVAVLPADAAPGLVLSAALVAFSASAT
jgi:threonine/homoserine/homoserine lactone efflux protein